MAAITTSPGYGTATWPATSRRAPSGAIPRVSRRVSPTTYRRRRLALATSAAACVVVAAMAGVALGGSPLAAPERRPASVSISAASSGAAGSATPASDSAADAVTVRPGDTLWSIVTRLAPDDDPRPLVDELSEARDGAPLQVGEHIELPQ